MKLCTNNQNSTLFYAKKFSILKIKLLTCVQSPWGWELKKKKIFEYFFQKVLTAKLNDWFFLFFYFFIYFNCWIVRFRNVRGLSIKGKRLLKSYWKRVKYFLALEGLPQQKNKLKLMIFFFFFYWNFIFN